MADNKKTSQEELDLNKSEQDKAEAMLQKMFDTATKKVDDMIKAAEKKANKIISDAQQSVEPTVKKKQVRGPEPMVTIRLPRDSEKGDRFVSLNGKVWRIQRGHNVQVPLSIAEIIENSAKQDEMADIYQEQLANKFQADLNKIR